MYPVLKKLYPDKKDLAAAMKRHLTLYQTSHYLATFQMGITAAMEEENAQDADFDTDSIGAVQYHAGGSWRFSRRAGCRGYPAL